MNQLLNLLLPWPWRDEINWTTDLFVYGILLLFIFLSYRFYFSKIKPRVELIGSLANRVNEYSHPAKPEILPRLKDVFDVNPKLGEVWQEFENSLITRDSKKNGGRIVYKTDEASVFFSEERLIGQYMTLRFWNSVPSLLVGLGILGTFIGLVAGLIPFSDINFEETEDIQTAIQGLLSGVSTAFVTSVWGMLTSLIFNTVEKRGIGQLNRQLVSLQRALDQLFTLTTQEEISYRQEDELAQQTQALKAFSTDLGDRIKTEMDNILTPSFDSLHKAVMELQKHKEETSVEAIKQLVTEFQKSLSGAATAQLEALARTISKAGSSLKTLPEELGDMMDGVKKQVTEIVDHNSDTLLTLMEKQADQIAAVNTQIDNSRRTLEKSDETLQQIDASVTNVRQLIETTQKLSGQLVIGTENLKIAGEKLMQAGETFNRANTEYLKSNRETIEILEVMFSESQDQLKQFGQKFATIDSGLKSIFEEIQRGLESYSVTTRETTRQYLNEFSEQFTQAAEALAGGVEALTDSCEELADMIDQLSKQKGDR